MTDRGSGVLGNEMPRAAYQGAEVDAQASIILRAARNNFAVENTLGNRIHALASLPQPDQIPGMVGKPYSIPAIFEDGLANKMQELSGKLEKWAFGGRSKSGGPACQWRHLEGGWGKFGGRQVTGGQGGHVHDLILFLAFVDTYLARGAVRTSNCVNSSTKSVVGRWWLSTSTTQCCMFLRSSLQSD